MRLISVIARRFSNLAPNERDVLDAYRESVRDCPGLNAQPGMKYERKKGVEH